MTASGWRAVRVLVGVAILTAVLMVTGVDAAIDGLRSLDAATLLAGAALAVPTTVACAWRWRLVASRLGLGIDLVPAVAACYRAQFLNTTLPGGVAGDVHRGVGHGRAAGATGRGLRAVVVERLAGQLVLATVAVPVLLLVPSAVQPDLPGAVSWLAAAGAVVALALGTRWLSGSLWPAVAVASMVALVGNLATYLLAARAVGVSASSATLVPLVLLVFLAAALPTNVAGWGPREGMAAWSFGAAGLGADQGLATGVAFGAIVLVANLPGALLLVTSRSRAAVAAGPSPDAGPRSRVDA